MPSDRRTASDFGLAVRWASSREMLSPPPCFIDVAQLARSTAVAATVLRARNRIAAQLLLVRVEHVFEAHPVGVEIEIDVARGPVAVLANQQLGGALNVPRRL